MTRTPRTWPFYESNDGRRSNNLALGHLSSNLAFGHRSNNLASGRYPLGLGVNAEADKGPRLSY